MLVALCKDQADDRKWWRLERNYEGPAGWLDWEKRHHVAYASQAVAKVLDRHKAAGTGVGILVLVGLSPPT
ncbi:hypothetical protein EJ110_NYTH48207 [Nymphaea thermarum]|nr:hypothetical protein EJ110_NYTH48207 [Nymphaea thermarum]